MEYLKDIGQIVVILGGGGFIFKFLLNGFKGHLELLQKHWADEVGLMHESQRNMHVDLQAHITSDKEALDGIQEEVSEIKSTFSTFITKERGESCRNYDPQ